MHALTLDRLLSVMARNKYPLYSDGEYNLNLIGIRAADQDANTFNDTMIVLYWLDRVPMLHRFAMTTDPGVYYRQHPMNVDGTAVLAPGHYAQCWSIGRHRNRYAALVQSGAMAVYRDADKDKSIDLDKSTIQVGQFGINLHRASIKHQSTQVDRWSAGCQVLQAYQDFELLMALARKSAMQFGAVFSYTLLEAAEC